MKCRECDNEGTLRIHAWSLEGRSIVVPVCPSHGVCPECGKPTEISPISLQAECFMHGPPVKV